MVIFFMNKNILNKNIEEAKFINMDKIFYLAHQIITLLTSILFNRYSLTNIRSTIYEFLITTNFYLDSDHLIALINEEINLKTNNVNIILNHMNRWAGIFKLYICFLLLVVTLNSSFVLLYFCLPVFIAIIIYRYYIRVKIYSLILKLKPKLKYIIKPNANIPISLVKEGDIY